MHLFSRGDQWAMYLGDEELQRLYDALGEMMEPWDGPYAEWAHGARMLMVRKVPALSWGVYRHA